MDYGHELVFGTFITPTNQPGGHPVELAQLSERVGLDLATFQDHPYQPGFHDTWTLMSYIAARTERISFTANVLNLPLRQPVVMARSAASLDLLTGGRIELGLGAGAFWDAIEAAGGRRLSAGQAVTALEEAIEIIRAVLGRFGLREDHRKRVSDDVVDVMGEACLSGSQGGDLLGRTTCGPGRPPRPTAVHRIAPTTRATSGPVPGTRAAPAPARRSGR